MYFIQISFLIVLASLNQREVRALNSVWEYECNSGYCLKVRLNNTLTAQSFAACNLLCLEAAGLWPKPTGNVSVSNLTRINIDNIGLVHNAISTNVSTLLETAFDVFLANIESQLPTRLTYYSDGEILNSESAVLVNISVNDKNAISLKLATDEGYTISASQVEANQINVLIMAETFFGARHALETLSQIVVYDDLRDQILFPNHISIVDAPKYPWRGISLDTSRNFITVKSILTILRGMAASKLNTLHWHLTDTASFPYVSKSLPELSQYGAYSPAKTYRDTDVRHIIEFARVRGIRIVPEFDAPAHVGEGWQNMGVLTCFNQHPWDQYCVEPPCGQFDPSVDILYDYLEVLYSDLVDQFEPEVFHFGGDEVNTGCWNSTQNLTAWMVDVKGWNLTEESFFNNVWAYFQTNARKRLEKVAGEDIKGILWNSDLTALENVTSILPPEKYIIQIWTSGTDTAVQTLLDKNYSIILSNYDASYLDCGFSSWVADGNNWCTPYKGWQLAYGNTPVSIAGEQSNQVLGGEAALWTEQADSASTAGRIFPRASALGEALWTEPTTDYAAAEERMLLHRERLVSLGIDADALEPEWCLQNQQNCPLSGKFNV